MKSIIHKFPQLPALLCLSLIFVFLSFIESLTFALSISKFLLIVFYLTLFSPIVGGGDKDHYYYPKVFALLSFSCLIVGASFLPQYFWQYWSVLFLLVPLMLFSKTTLQRWGDARFWRAESRFFLCFFIPLLFLCLSPDWASGEKPMDLSFLNFYARSGIDLSLDPWFAGGQSSYYTTGYALSGIWALSAGLDGNQFYLIALSLWISLFLLSCRYLSNSWVKTLGLLCLLPLGALRHILPPFSFVNFWQMTRVYAEPYFSEFPLWSYLFYDLHPHVMSYSLAAVIFVLYRDFLRFQLKGRYIFFFSTILILLYFVNRWDFLFWSAALLVSVLIDYKKVPVRSAVLASLSVLMVISAHLIFFPQQQKVILEFWELKAWFGTVLPGVFWQLSLLLILSVWASWKLKNTKYLSLFFIVFFIFSFLMVMDPVNSVFKFQTSLATLLLLIGLVLMREIPWSKKLEKVTLLASVAIVLLLTGHRQQQNRDAQMSLYLSADRFLAQHRADEAKLSRFLKDKKFDHSVILEAPSESFQYSGALISTYSGVPSFLGWKNHLRIRGVDSQEILRRSFISSEIYRSLDLEQTLEHLRREKIDLIVLGQRERQIYRGEGLRKFSAYPEFFEHLYSSDDIHLFRLRDL